MNHYWITSTLGNISGMVCFFVFAYKDGLGHFFQGWYRSPFIRSVWHVWPKAPCSEGEALNVCFLLWQWLLSFLKNAGRQTSVGWDFSNHRTLANLSWKLFDIFWHMSTHINLWMICRLSSICVCLGVRWVIGTSYISNIDFFPWKCSRCGGLQVYPNCCYPKFTINVHQPCTCSSGIPTAPCVLF